MVLKVVTGGNFNGPIYYQGTWDANANNPFLQSGVGFTGEYYIVSVAGNTNLDGISNWQVGDWAIFNSATNKWEKIDGGSYGTTLNIVNDSSSNTAYNVVLTKSSGGLVDTEYVDNGNLTFNPSTGTLASPAVFIGTPGTGVIPLVISAENTAVSNLEPTIGITNSDWLQITCYDNLSPDANIYNYSLFADSDQIGFWMSTINEPYNKGNVVFQVNQYGAALFGSASGSISGFGAAGQVLTSQGNASPALWTTPANGTVVSISAGTGITATPNPITGSGSIAITNTSVSAGSYGNSTTVATFTVNAQGQLTQAANVTISVPSSQVTGLGTMATQNANAVAITGGSINVTTTNHTANVTANATFATSSLPLVPAGYIVYDLNGTLVKIPYYAV
jgi:trimeric autotransporter adhesin